MTQTSRYIQLNDYLLLEYYYEGFERDSVITKTWKLTNNITDTYQFLNGNDSKLVTGNVLDWSASIFDSSINKWAMHDIDGDNLISSEYYDLEEVTAVPTVKYDTIKVHMLSGYIFEGADGIIIEVKFKENSGRDFNALSYVYLKTESAQINFNEKPLLIGERNYDRHLLIEIPSLFYIQNEYWPVANLPIEQQDNTFAYNFSYPVSDNPNPGGYLQNSLIYVNVHEISETIVEDNVTYLKTNRDFNVSFNNADTYALLANTIRESNNGQYFEYFATWGGEFIEDYIQKLNASTSGDWGIINQIEVYEQVGTSSFMTTNITELQNDTYDTPKILRPVILNANVAFSFSIDYTMRLYNKLSGEQIVRKASLTSYAPKKYGKELLRINIDEGFKPIKVYNKLEEKSIARITDELKSSNVSTKYVHTFIQNYNVSVNINSKFGKDLSAAIYGQGKGILFLNPFDNVIRFKILKESKDNKEMLPLNLINAKVFLVFMKNDETKIRIPSDTITEVLPKNGEFQFSVDSKLSTTLLKSKNSDFFIVTKDDELANETLIYQGTYSDFKNYDLIMNNGSSSKIVEPLTITKTETIKTNADKTETIKSETITTEPSKNKTNIKSGTDITGKVSEIIPDVVLQTDSKDTILKNEFLNQKEKLVLLNKSKIDKKRVSFYKRIKPEDTTI